MERALQTASPHRTAYGAPKAIVAPHAGYAYSGPIAASAYASLLPAGEHVERVVLLGPSHFVPVDAIAVPSVDALQTPLGPVPVDTTTRDDLLGAGLVVIDDEPHRNEHSLEVQLPFLQVTLGDFSVVPLAVGHVPADQVAAVLDRVWDGPETAVVVSTDLSHYHDHRTAQVLDKRTADVVVAKDPDSIGPEDACGAFPLRGLLEAARQRDLSVELLDLRTSADTAGDPSRVVGYGAFAVG